MSHKYVSFKSLNILTRLIRLPAKGKAHISGNRYFGYEKNVWLARDFFLFVCFVFNVNLMFTVCVDVSLLFIRDFICLKKRDELLFVP